MSAETNIAKVKAFIATAQVYAKFIASLIGGVLVVASTIIPTDWAAYVTLGLVVITSFAVYKFPNAEVPTE